MAFERLVAKLKAIKRRKRLSKRGKKGVNCTYGAGKERNYHNAQKFLRVPWHILYWGRLIAMANKNEIKQYVIEKQGYRLGIPASL